MVVVVRGGAGGLTRPSTSGLDALLLPVWAVFIFLFLFSRLFNSFFLITLPFLRNHSVRSGYQWAEPVSPVSPGVG